MWEIEIEIKEYTKKKKKKKKIGWEVKLGAAVNGVISEEIFKGLFIIINKKKKKKKKKKKEEEELGFNGFFQY